MQQRPGPCPFQASLSLLSPAASLSFHAWSDALEAVRRIVVVAKGFRMNNKLVATTVLAALVIVGGAWVGRDSAVVGRVAHAIGAPGGGSTLSTGATLSAAGVHKCQANGGVSYLDQPCPKGSREVAANGGTVTVMSFPKATPAPDSAGSGIGLGTGIANGRLLKSLSPDEVDKMREKQIDAATTRPN
jgi:hypothetical protein